MPNFASPSEVPRGLKSTLHDLLPSSFACRCKHGVGDIVRRQAVAEARPGHLAGAQPVQEVGHLVDEGVLVADLQAGHPPVLHVGMVAVGDVDRSPAAQRAFVAVVEVLQAVQVVQVPGDRGVLAVDLEACTAPCGRGRSGSTSNVASEPLLEARQEGAGVVDADLLDLAR